MVRKRKSKKEKVKVFTPPSRYECIGIIEGGYELYKKDNIYAYVMKNMEGAAKWKSKKDREVRSLESPITVAICEDFDIRYRGSLDPEELRWTKAENCVLKECIDTGFWDRNCSRPLPRDSMCSTFQVKMIGEDIDLTELTLKDVREKDDWDYENLTTLIEKLKTPSMKSNEIEKIVENYIEDKIFIRPEVDVWEDGGAIHIEDPQNCTIDVVIEGLDQKNSKISSRNGGCTMIQRADKGEEFEVDYHEKVKEAVEKGSNSKCKAIRTWYEEPMGVSYHKKYDRLELWGEIECQGEDFFADISTPEKKAGAFIKVADNFINVLNDIEEAIELI